MERLWDEDETSAAIGWTVSTLQKKRVSGGGPPFVKLGRSVRYRPSDVAAYVDKRVVSSTSQQVAA
jgi:predicted DNA-binding transcriptional regulator AlpA